MTNATLRQQRFESLKYDFKFSRPVARQLFFHQIRFLYSFCEPVRKLPTVDILPDNTKLFHERVLSADHTRQQNQRLALLSHMFVISGVSSKPILEPDLSFTPNENINMLMKILRIKYWTQLGTGMKTLEGNKWSDLIHLLGLERPTFSFAPPALQRLLSNTPCYQILKLCSEVSLCKLRLEVKDFRLRDSLKILISAHRCPSIALSEYATCDKALEWFCELLKELPSFNVETRYTLLMAAAPMLRDLIQTRAPPKEHFRWKFRLTAWIDPLAFIFRMELGCCEYHLWVNLSRKIHEELIQCCASYPESYPAVVDIVHRFLPGPISGDSYHIEELQETNIDTDLQVSPAEPRVSLPAPRVI